MSLWKNNLAVTALLSIFMVSSISSAEQTTSEKQPNRAMLVLDASGSMWGQIDGKAKITIAKEVVSEIVNDWDQGSPLGLMAYGHNSEGDCKDIEQLQPVSQIDKSAYLKKISKLNPKGKTPLTAAVIKAAEALNYQQKKATVLLISDGMETCHLDPCEEARTLKAKGLDFIAHVISFDVPESETIGLRCLAQETGGMYLEAGNADELKKAFGEASAVITDNKILKISEASVEVPVDVIAGSVFKTVWLGPKNRLDRLIVKSTDGKKSFAYSYIGGVDVISPSYLTAPETPGQYLVHYQLADGRSLAETKLNVVPAKASVKTPTEVIAGSAFKVEWTGPKNKYDSVAIFKPGEQKKLNLAYIFRENDLSPAEVVAPEKPGDYEVRYFTNGNKILASQMIKVVAAAASVKAPVEVTAGSEFKVDWTGPKNKYDVVAVFKPGENKKLNSVYIFNEKDISPAKVTAPEKPGYYEVRYFTNGKKTLASQMISVVAATASVKAPAEVIAGSEFQVDWTGPKNKYDVVAVFKPGKNKKLNSVYVFNEKDISPAKVTAPEKPGYYEVRYFTDGKNTLATQIISVVAATASVKAPQEVIAGSPFLTEWTGPKNKYDLVGVFKPGEKTKLNFAYVFHDKDESPAKIVAPKNPGNYEVRYFTSGGNTLAKQTFKVVLDSTK